jgi:hypothetical protein
LLKRMYEMPSVSQLKRPLTVVCEEDQLGVVQEPAAWTTYNANEPAENHRAASTNVQEGEQAECADGHDRVERNPALGAFGEDLGCASRDCCDGHQLGCSLH